MIRYAVFLSLLIAAGAFGMSPSAQAQGTGSGTTFSFSEAEVDTVHDTPITRNVNTFSTELKVVMGGSTISDETFPLAFSDPVFQGAIATARAALLTAGAASTSGPTLLSSVDTPGSGTNTITTGTTSTTQNSVKVFFPIPPAIQAVVQTGDFGVCQSFVLDANGYPTLSGCTLGGFTFTSAPGTDIDGFALTLVDIETTTTTTNTDLLTQVFELDGIAVPSVEVPEPASIGFLITGIVSLAFVRRAQMG